MFSPFIVLILSCLVRSEIFDETQYYNAAVYEHVIRGSYETDTTKQYIEKNLAAYNRAASIAAENNADILAFPEFGLYPPKAREALINDIQYVPDPKWEFWNPCLEPDRYENSFVLANLSCMARRHNIVIVANILSKMPCNAIRDFSCPSDGVYMYNTNVAFNRSGLLIGRYRKTHLYFEDTLNVLPEPEYIVFETDFGVFGTFVCIDIVWKEAVKAVERHSPDGIIFTTLWFEYLQPGMNSLQVQQSWAIRNNVTIIAANRQQPNIAAFGSGVYVGGTGIGNYISKSDGQSRVLISKAPRRGVQPPEDYPPAIIVELKDSLPDNGRSNNISSGVCSKKILGPPTGFNDLRCNDFDLSNFTLKRIVESEGIAETCNNGLCCNIRYEAELSNEDYYLAVLNGTYILEGRYKLWLESCIVVRCDSFDGKVCSTFPMISNTVFHKLDMKGNFSTQYVYPSILISGMHLAPSDKWSFKDESLYFKRLNDKLLFAALHGRSYERDP